MPGKKKTDLREACIEEAMAIVDEKGIEELSLREVARRLGVSHQAPYKHFPSRDHILAELVSRSYTAFAAHLEARPRTGDPEQDLGAMGEAYLEYAFRHPLQYRLMFGTPLPDPDHHPEMMRKARHAFSLLQHGIDGLHTARSGAGPHPRTAFDALSVWFTLHGLATVMQSRVVDTMELPADAMERMAPEILQRIGWMLSSEVPDQEP
jgi:AcrR family transcriptional regulator